jgi:hypothetical protein
MDAWHAVQSLHKVLLVVLGKGGAQCASGWAASMPLSVNALGSCALPGVLELDGRPAPAPQTQLDESEEQQESLLSKMFKFRRRGENGGGPYLVGCCVEPGNVKGCWVGVGDLRCQLLARRFPLMTALHC